MARGNSLPIELDNLRPLVQVSDPVTLYALSLQSSKKASIALSFRAWAFGARLSSAIAGGSASACVISRAYCMF